MILPSPEISEQDRAGWPIWADAFLSALARKGTIVSACREIGRHRSTVYEALDNNPSFKAACAVARSTRADALAERAFDLAINGTLKPVFHRGHVVHLERRFDSRLIISLLPQGTNTRRNAAIAPNDASAVAAALWAIRVEMLKTVPPEPPTPEGPAG